MSLGLPVSLMVRAARVFVAHRKTNTHLVWKHEAVTSRIERIQPDSQVVSVCRTDAPLEAVY